MNWFLPEEFKKHVSIMIRTNREFREHFTNLMLDSHSGKVENPEWLIGRITRSLKNNPLDNEQQLKNILKQRKMIAIIRVMHMTRDTISWSRRLRDFDLFQETSVDVIKIADNGLRISDFQVFDTLDEEEKIILNQLTTEEIDLLSNFTEAGMKVFLTIANLSMKEKSFLLHLKKEQIETSMKFGFQRMRNFSNLDIFEEGVRVLNWKERIVLRDLIIEQGDIIKNFTVLKDMEEVLESLSRFGTDDVDMFHFADSLHENPLKNLSENQKRILKKTDIRVFRLTSFLAKPELEEFLLLPKGTFGTISREGFWKKLEILIPKIPEGNPLIPKFNEEEDKALGLLSHGQIIILSRIHKLPPRSVRTLLDLHLDRIKSIMTMLTFHSLRRSELGFDPDEQYLWDKLNSLSPVHRHDIAWMTETEWYLFHSIRNLDVESQSTLINLAGQGIDVLETISSLSEAQFHFVRDLSRTGLRIFAGNSQLTPETVHEVMQLHSELKQSFFLNLDLQSRLLIGETNVTEWSPKANQVFHKMGELDEREIWWSHLKPSEFIPEEIELFQYLNRDRAKWFVNLLRSLDTRDTKELDSKLLANVMIATRFHNTESLESVKSDPVFFMELLRLSVEDSLDEHITLGVVEEIQRRDFDLNTLARVYDYSNPQQVHLFGWMINNSAHEILNRITRRVLFDRLSGINRLTVDEIVDPALHQQLSQRGYELAQAIFMSYQDSTFLTKVFNAEECLMFLESPITMGVYENPYLNEQIHKGRNAFEKFGKNELSLLQVSNYYNRGNDIPLLNKLKEEELVEFLKTTRGREYFQSSLNNGRVNLLRFLHRVLDLQDLRDLIQFDDYFVVRKLVVGIKSAEHAQDLASVLKMTKDIDPGIPEKFYADTVAELIARAQEKDFTAAVSVIRFFITDSIEDEKLVTKMRDKFDPRVQLIALDDTLPGCYHRNTDRCIDSLQLGYMTEETKYAFNKMRNVGMTFYLDLLAYLASPGKPDLELFLSKISNPDIQAMRRILERKSYDKNELKKSVIAASFGYGMFSMDDEDLEIPGTTGSPIGDFKDFVRHEEMDIPIPVSVSTTLEKHNQDYEFYWSMFRNDKAIERISGDEGIMELYINQILNRFRGNYARIGLSLPRWIVGKTERYVQGVSEVSLTPAKLVYNRRAVARNPFDEDIASYAGLLPDWVSGYGLVCGPGTESLEVETKIQQTSPEFNKSTIHYRLPGMSDDWCQNVALYAIDMTPKSKRMILHIPQDYFDWESSESGPIDLIFSGNDIKFVDTGPENSTDHFILKNDLSKCQIHKTGLNFFYIKTNRLLCDLDERQDNVAVVDGDFVDSRSIRSVIGNEKRNKIVVRYADFVDGRGGNDNIIVESEAVVRGHFGDTITGTARVVLPGNFDEIHSIKITGSTFIVSTESGEFIKIDQKCKLITADGYSIVPMRTDDLVRGIRLRIMPQGNIGFANQFIQLQNIRNPNFELVRYSSSSNQRIILTDTSNNIFMMDENIHNYFWQAPLKANNLYIFNRVGGNVMVSQTHGILDFRALNIDLESVALSMDDETHLFIDYEKLHVHLLPNYNVVRVTFDGNKYYKLVYDELERDYCSHPIKVRGRIFMDSQEFVDRYDCLDFQSDKVHFFDCNGHLMVVSAEDLIVMKNFYTFVNESTDLTLLLNHRASTPEEFWKRVRNPSSIKYYRVDERELQIYHNQPEDKRDIGLIDLREWSTKEFVMWIHDESLWIVGDNKISLKVENWGKNPVAREILVAFKDGPLLNWPCIISNCSAENIIDEFGIVKLQRSRPKRESCVTENLGFLLFVFQSWLNKSYPLPVEIRRSSEEILADASCITQYFEEILEKLGVSVEGVDFVDVSRNVGRLLRGEKYSEIPEVFRSVVEGLGNKTLVNAVLNEMKLSLRMRSSPQN